MVLLYVFYCTPGLFLDVDCNMDGLRGLVVFWIVFSAVLTGLSACLWGSVVLHGFLGFGLGAGFLGSSCVVVDACSEVYSFGGILSWILCT